MFDIGTRTNLLLTTSVGPDVPPWTRLVDFIRGKVKLSGTKALCREGGCGVCTVVVTVPDPETTGRKKTYSVQAVSIFSPFFYSLCFPLGTILIENTISMQDPSYAVYAFCALDHLIKPHIFLP